MTSISRPSRPAPSFTIAEYSRSVISTFASPWLSMKAMVSASRRVFSVLSTAPHIGTPKWHSNISGVLLSITATVSPAPTPRAASAEARRRVVRRGLLQAEVVDRSLHRGVTSARERTATASTPRRPRAPSR
jgi:hypothetical protein